MASFGTYHMVKPHMLNKLHYRMRAVADVMFGEGPAKLAAPQWEIARAALERQGAKDVPQQLPDNHQCSVPRIAHPYFTSAIQELVDLPRLQRLKAVKKEGLRIESLKYFVDGDIVDRDVVETLIVSGFTLFSRGDYWMPLMEEMGELHHALANIASNNIADIMDLMANAFHAYMPTEAASLAFSSLLHDEENAIKYAEYLQPGVQQRIMKEIITGTANYTVADYDRLRGWGVISEGMHDFFVKRVSPPSSFHFS